MIDLKAMAKRGATVAEMVEAQAEADELDGWVTIAEVEETFEFRIAAPPTSVPAFYTLDIGNDFGFERGAILMPTKPDDCDLSYLTAELKGYAERSGMYMPGELFIAARELNAPESWVTFQKTRTTLRGNRKAVSDKWILREIREQYELPALKMRDIHIARENPGGGSQIWVTPVPPVYGAISCDRGDAYRALVEDGLSVWEWLESGDGSGLSESEIFALGGSAAHRALFDIGRLAGRGIALAAATAAVSAALVGDESSSWFTDERREREASWMRLTGKSD